jgi:hypothetical protein
MALDLVGFSVLAEQINAGTEANSFVRGEAGRH